MTARYAPAVHAMPTPGCGHCAPDRRIHAMNRPRLPALTLAAALACVLAGCGRDGADGTRDGGTVALDVPAPTPPPSPSPDPTFDAAGFSGSFQAGDTTVQLSPDGRYRLRVRAQRAHADLVSEGLWSLEPGSGQLLLVPHAADEPRQRYSMPSADELVPEGGGLSLRRIGFGVH
jgi:hypothetical protein